MGLSGLLTFFHNFVKHQTVFFYLMAIFYYGFLLFILKFKARERIVRVRTNCLDYKYTKKKMSCIFYVNFEKADVCYKVTGFNGSFCDLKTVFFFVYSNIFFN